MAVKHPQLELPLARKPRGGKRRGAGRPAKCPWRPSEPHRARERFEGWRSFHVTLRVTRAVKTLRRRRAYHAFRLALLAILARPGFRVTHISLERDHVHLVVEAQHHVALARGMQAFQISAARRLNRALDENRRGVVFVDRYHLVRITSPTQARNAIRYVLNNWRHHGTPEQRDWRVDYFSSGPTFDGWADFERTPEPFERYPDYEPLPVSPPRTWLLAKGWRVVGKIFLDDVPGSPPRA